MAHFLQANIDYILFVHSLAILLVPIQAWFLVRSDGGFHRAWLGAFFLSQTINIWLDILSLSGLVGENAASIQGIIQLATFLSLAELARSSTQPIGRFRPGIWIHIPLAAIPLLLIRFIPDLTLRASVSYSLALPCGAWFGIILWDQARHHPFRQARVLLRQTALAIVAYSISLAFCTPHNASLSSALSHTEPDQLIQVAVVCSSLVAVLMFGRLHFHIVERNRHTRIFHDTASSAKWQNHAWILLGLTATIAGWVAAELTGRNLDSQMRQQVQDRTLIAAAAIPTEMVESLAWNESDLSNPSYQRLKALMKSLARANKDLRFAMLMGARDGKAFFLVDSESPDSKDYSPPGQYYEDAEVSYLAELKKKEKFVLGPISDHWGTWITSSVPIECHLSKAGHVTMDLDIAVMGWQSQINQARFPVLLITLLIIVLLIGSWLSQIKIREHAAQVAISERRNSALVEGSPTCIQMFDQEGLCLTINQNGVKALGREKSEIIGRPFYSIWPIEARQTIMDAVHSTLQGSQNMFEADYACPDGRCVVWRVSMNPIKDHTGSVVSFVSISMDITDRKISEQALRKAKEAAESATRIKSEFLAVMSHEIRTPLSGVIGMLGLLQKQKLIPKQRRYAELARESAEALLDILNDLLDTAKIESGKLAIESIPFSPRKELNRVVEIMRTRADAKELSLSCEIDDAIPEVLYGDPLRLRQVLTNLISNAIKFTFQGGIIVILQGEIVGGFFVHLHLTVSDTGTGIDPSAIGRIFNKFEQEDSSTTRLFGGTGLGLAIVKSIADIMGGDVSVTSTLGKGSTFTFSAIMALGELDALAESMPEPMSSGALHSSACLSLLCAEDNAVNRLVIQHSVQQMGHEADFAENGREAVEKLRTKRYDAVLMDSRMPEMDGFQATMLIRSPESGVLDPLIQIIALTANASLNYRDQCLASGMNDYLEKPVREDALHAALERVIEYQHQRGVELMPMRKTAPPCATANEDVGQPAQSNPPQGMSVDELLAMAGADTPITTEPAISGAPSMSPEALQSITRQYLQDAPLRLREMANALERKEGPSLARAAHSLKSMSHYVSAMEISTHCAQIEKLADEEHFEGIAYLIRCSELEFAQVQIRLQDQLLG